MADGAGPDIPDRVDGPYGFAERFPFDATDPRAAQTVAYWLITAPSFHPVWSQYVLACVRLDDDVEGFPPPNRKFDGATHEILLVALDPTDGPVDMAAMDRYALSGQLPILTPVNICEQFTATDAEMRELAQLAAHGVVAGALNPETGDAPTRIREQWLSAMVKTLAHIRGEEHAR
jgi:hypothetical protein